MAFTVQTADGTTEDANSYPTVEYFIAYHTDRNVEAVVNSEYTTEQIQSALISATDYVDNRYRYKGNKLISTQTTEFPREDLYDFDGNEVTGLPARLLKATCEYALRALVSALAPDPKVDQSGQQVTEKTSTVGPITTTVKYAQAATISVVKPYPAADMLLRQYITSGSRVIV